jgi:hypothetical protein
MIHDWWQAHRFEFLVESIVTAIVLLVFVSIMYWESRRR